MRKKHTFEQLDQMTAEELVQMRDEARDELARVRQQRYALIGQIMFYEDMVEKERANA